MSEMKILGTFVISVFRALRLVHVNEYTKNGELYIEFNNLTLINFVLKICGPLHEQTLTIILLAVQVVCSCVAFGIRYPLALAFYGEVVA